VWTLFLGRILRTLYRKMTEKLILGIETSCDETAAAVVADGREVLSNVVASQIAKHAPFGGVIPELAAREHLENIPEVVSTALIEAEAEISDISAISVTNGPGLLPALLVGMNFAKGLAVANNLPFIGINHFIAHIYGTYLEFGIELLRSPDTYPILALVVSGGHTSLVLIDGEGNIEMVGSTIDDAAGEAFDKAAKLLSLGYPGGPVVEKISQKGDPAKFAFPRPLTGGTGKPMKPEHRFNFSFSGIKTALLYHCKNYDEECHLEGQLLYDTVASYQKAIVDVLTMKTVDAVGHFGAKSVVVCGGVACNTALRNSLREALKETPAEFYVAPPKYCTDNAAMIAGLGWHYYERKEFTPLDSDVFTRMSGEEKITFLLN
jgi:N6-L-threonylcarbamoyladenine synthase